MLCISKRAEYGQSGTLTRQSIHSGKDLDFGIATIQPLSAPLNVRHAIFPADPPSHSHREF